MKFANARTAVAAGAALAALCAFAYHHHYARPAALQPGDRLAGIRVSSIAGTPVTLRAAGRPEVINVFATWCPPCRMETPAFAAFAHHLEARGVAVVGIDQQEPAEAVAQFKRTFGLTYPVYIDNGTATHDLLGARMIPATLAVDAAGIILWRHLGPLTARDYSAIDRIVSPAKS